MGGQFGGFLWDGAGKGKMVFCRHGQMTDVEWVQHGSAVLDFRNTQ
jgi:hypothetical protein